MKQPYTIKELDYIAGKVAEQVISHINHRDEVLTTAQVAEMLGISVNAVRQRCRAGSLPGKKRGKHYLFSRNEIFKLL